MEDIQNTPPLDDKAKAAEPIAKALLLASVQTGTASDVSKILDDAAACNVAIDSLLKYGNSLGQTPLQLAASKNGQLKVVELLLSKGAGIDQKNARTGETALHIAAEGGQIEILDCLLAANAEYALQDNVGRIAEDAAKAVQQNQAEEVLKAYRLKKEKEAAAAAAAAQTWFDDIRKHNRCASATWVILTSTSTLRRSSAVVKTSVWD